jgi:hypothetical protein
VVNEDRARLVSSAHQEATKRLKKQFPAEYRALVLSVYEERGLKVRKRRTKEEMLADQLAEARRLLEEHS